MQRYATVALWAVAAGVVAGWLTLAALHVSDEYRVGHLQGNWIAAAESARIGHLYPPPYDGERYAGTRWMPLAILANAAASALAGDPLIGGKLLAAVLMGTLLVLCVTVLRQMSCPWASAVALSTVIVATDTGLQAGTTIGGDLLPLVLQVAVLAIVLRSHHPAALAIAGGLAGLALATKLTAGWAILAVPTWLIARRQLRPAALVLAASITTVAVVGGLMEMLTGGGLSRHLQWFSTAGVVGARSLWRGPNQLLFNLQGNASAGVVLLPLAVFSALWSDGWRRLAVVHFSLVYAFLFILVIYSDLGTGSNQLIDLVVLMALAVGHLFGRTAGTAVPGGRAALQAAIALTVIWAVGFDLVRTVLFDVRRSISAVRAGEGGQRPTLAVAGTVRPGEDVLSEDPSIEVALGRRPIVLDPFMLTRLDRIHPEWVDPLITRISQRRFGLVVLVVSLDDPSVEYWWTDYHFGPRIAKALRQSYRFDRTIGRFYLYRPAP